MIENLSSLEVQRPAAAPEFVEAMVILQVAIPAPLATLFDYLPPLNAPSQQWTPGLRLLVPFGRRQLLGILMGVTAHSDHALARLKRVDAVLDAVPLLTALDLKLIAWAAGYYQQPLGEALISALPTRLRKIPLNFAVARIPPGPPFSKGGDEEVPFSKGGDEKVTFSNGGFCSPFSKGGRGDFSNEGFLAASFSKGEHAANAPALSEKKLGKTSIFIKEINHAPFDQSPQPPFFKGGLDAPPFEKDASSSLPFEKDASSSPPFEKGTSSYSPFEKDASSYSPFEKGTSSSPPFEKGGSGGICATGGFILNSDQQIAVTAIQAALGTFQPFLLDGVTGSGKTEVYIRVLAQIIAAGQQALVIVPEIGLTPQLQARFSSRLSATLTVLHSALTPLTRERNWQHAASGNASILLGTRSAIFVPLPRLALIVVDEEHDQSLKQQDGFRYSARDVAVRRAQLVGCPIILGSATPTLETLYNAQRGRYHWLHLPRRAGVAQPPTITLLDIRNQRLRAGLSPHLREQIAHELAAGNQVLLFLNRRGYAPVLTCHACGWIGGCPRCDARLTLHLNPRRFWCHHCGFTRPVPTHCPSCKSADLRMLGRGTERVEEELQTLFPDATSARIDSDSTRRKGELERLLDAAQRGAVQILLGTQMLAKGHDFPGVTLVGILDLDGVLYATDFRAPERAAQLIVQVAGRAGRAERRGRVILQTRHPEHPLLQALVHKGYSGFAAAALRERQETEFPPFTHLALLRADATDETVPLEFLREAKRLAAQLPASEHIVILGPAPAPLARRVGRHHAQLLVQCAERMLLQRFLNQWGAMLQKVKRSKGLHWSVDVDPQEMF
jgi:primosomal protein N' (replication factor Y) (superfamily II helicase)